MALQDIPQYDFPNIPYPYGSPEYIQAIMPFLQKQIQDQAEQTANARGGFYSGPAQANEQQAMSDLLYQMTSAGAQQAAGQQQTSEAQAFSQQQQQEAEQAQANLAREQGISQQKAGAVSGGLGSLGTLGGMYLMHKMGSGGGITADQLKDILAAQRTGGDPGIPWAPGAGAASGGAPGGGFALQGTPELADLQGGAPGGADIGVPWAPGSTGGASAGAPVNGGLLSSMTAPGMPGVGTAALSLPAAIYGSQAGLRTYGNDNPAKVGSGLGGLAGMIGGSMLGGPLGGAAGAGAGSFLGAQYGEHPGLALLGPAGLPFMIPGVGHAIQSGFINPISNGFQDIGHSIGNFFSHLF